MNKICCIVILLYFYFHTFNLTVTGQGYGPFSVIVAGNKDCKGPRKKECGVLNTTVVDNTTVHYDFDLRENVAPFQAKLTAIINNKDLWTVTIKDYCHHVILGQMMHRFMKVEGCTVLKGHYTFALDIQELTRTFRSGGTFFYGNVTFKSILFNDDCNFLCSVMTLTLSPLKKN